MSYKDFDSISDISSQLSVINEVMPLTGAFFSGTDYYKKKFINIVSGSAVSGGFWVSFYDGSPSSISSSALIDFSYGHNSSSLDATYSETFLNAQKQKIYSQMAEYLLGSKKSIFTFNNVQYKECFFLAPKRRIFKDEIQKGYVNIQVQMTGTGPTGVLNLVDTGAATSYQVGYAGDEAPLFSASTQIGKVYYNAGVIVIASGTLCPVTAVGQTYWSGTLNIHRATITGTIDNIVDGFANRINNIQFNNQTNLHSTIYFARALNSEFNYSSNPTFLDSDGRIVPTSGTDNQTRSYITSVGLYDVNNNLLAVCKLSEPLKKSPDSEVIIRCRLSY